MDSVICVVQGPVERHNPGELYLYDSDTGEETAIQWSRVAHYLAVLRAAKQQPEDPAMLGYARHVKKEWSDAIGTTLAHRILHCRKLLFFIDSPGGDGTTHERLIDLMQVVRSHGGEVTCYVGNAAASAAANLCAAANRIVATPDTQFMFHTPEAASERHRQITVAEEADATRSIHRFLKRKGEHFSRQYQEIINDPGNRRNEVRMRGADIADITEPDTDSVIAHAADDMHLDKVVEGSVVVRKIADFRIFNFIEAEVRRRFGIRVELQWNASRSSVNVSAETALPPEAHAWIAETIQQEY